MKKLKSTKGLVKMLLEKHPDCRSDDDRLYLEVLRHESRLKGVSLHLISIKEFLLHYKRLHGFTGFETVRRSRQKVQALHPHLAPTKKVQEKRMEKESEYRAFAHENI